MNTLKQIDIKNLRFYAKEAELNGWHTEGHIIEWRVIKQTLTEIADRLEAESQEARHAR